jgi:CRISPR-associated protein Csm1
MSIKKLDFLVLAALIHDVGKLLERGEIFPEVREDVYYLSFCPEHNGCPDHLHCAYTRKFCEDLEKKFDSLRKAQDKSWKDWAAAHHFGNEPCLEARVVRIADMLSLREREGGDSYYRDIHRKTLLEPVIERVCLGKNTNTSTRYRYPLKKLIPKEDFLFPLKGEDFSKIGLNLTICSDRAEGFPENSDQWGYLLAERSLADEYKQLAQDFLDEIDQLAQKRPDLPLPYLIVSLNSLLEIYTANVPSATNVRHPDISLFDHLRTTAAIAQSLYLYQLQKNNPLNGLDDENKKEVKWLLVCGDFSGIQEFISGLNNKGTISALCDRSFFVQYFCRISADFLLERLGLNRVAMLYNSGGKFYLLVPAHLKNKLFKVREQINKWLLEEFGGNIFLGLGLAEVTAEMFERGEMHKAWEICARSLENDRQIKFKEHFEPDFFAPRTDFNPVKSCPVCGNRFIQEGEKHCKICTQLEKLGRQLQKAKALLTVWGALDRIEDILKSGPVLEFSGFGAGLFLLDYECLEKAARLKFPLEAECVFMDQPDQVRLTDYPLPCAAHSYMYLGRWKERRRSWTFYDYAQNARVIKKMGILRMDMDNTELVFLKGLCFSRPSISRMATLSRQLNYFFSGYLGRLMEQDEFDKCQFVYAGGDDLFIVGSLDQLLPLARTINDKFKRFCCQNPDLSISGGLIRTHGGYPIYKAAQIAVQAERRAKNWRQIWKDYLKKKGKAPLDIEKGSFCFLDTPILWEDFSLAEKIKKLLEEEIRENKTQLKELNSLLGSGAEDPVLARSLASHELEGDRVFAPETNEGLFSCLLDMAETNKLKVQRLVQRKHMSLADAWLSIEYDPWRWRFAYQLKRRCKQYKEDKIGQWSDIILGNDRDRACLPVYVWLEMPVNWVKFSLGG